MADEISKQRRLAAIMFTDMVGYSAISQRNEALALELLDEHRGLLRKSFARHGGHEIEAVGDGFFVEFPSALAAAHCAAEIQRLLHERNLAQPPERQILLRIGLHLGDVVAQGDRVHGDGVNIAARIEPLAEPGGVCMSEDVARQIQNKIEFEVRKLGRAALKNIDLPMGVYKVIFPWSTSATSPSLHGTNFRRWSRPHAIRAASVLLFAILVVGGGIWWILATGEHSTSSPPTTSDRNLPTIAVLPFQNLSGDPRQEYFADGISEELITILAQYRNLSVIARNSMFTYKGRAVDVRQVGKEMHADFVLEGSVRRAAGAIRVTAQLLSAADGKHLWAETFERKLTAQNLFALQDEISEKVATQTAGDYGVIRMSRVRDTARKPPDQLQSYECILKVYEYNREQTPESRALATRCLERVTKSDSQYADAWGWLAMVYIDEFEMGEGKAELQLDMGYKALRQALENDPSNALAATIEAYYLYFKRDPRFFEKARKAVMANPRDFFTLAQMGQSVSWAGEWKEGRTYLDKAMEISPRPPGWVYLPISHRAYLDGDYRTGLEYGLKVDMPGWHWYHIAVAPNYARLGMSKEAKREIELLLKAYPDFAAHAYQEFRKWMWVDAEIEALIQGLRDAGLQVPPAHH